MAKAYWINTFRSISDPDKLAAYRELAGPAMRPPGALPGLGDAGPGVRVRAHGAHDPRRVRQRRAGGRGYESPAYQEALQALGDGAERDLRIIEAADG